MIGVLTYDAPHRKTQDLLSRLRAHGRTVEVVATPWEERKCHVPMISHRPGEPKWPAQPWDISPSEMCRNLGYEYSVCEKALLHEALSSFDMVLIGGAGILDKRAVDSTLIINSHCGALPYARGLDALKWAIYRSEPVGVTLHVVDEFPDSGFLIKQDIVPLYESDTFHAFAHRQYEMEMSLLVSAPEFVYELEDGFRKNLSRLPIDPDVWTINRRMKHITEMVMLKRFEQRRDHG